MQAKREVVRFGRQRTSPVNRFVEMPMKESAIDQVPAMRHEFIVRTIRILMVSLLALSWVLSISHCRIEAVPGWEFLRCAAAAPMSDKGGDPCDDAGCCLLESAQFHAPRQQEASQVVIVGVQAGPALDLVDESVPVKDTLGLPTEAPPELSGSWRFQTRAALPPRAPSFHS
jgi:hypothetical protein